MTANHTQQVMQIDTSVEELPNIKTLQAEQRQSRIEIVAIYRITDVDPREQFNILVSIITNESEKLQKEKKAAESGPPDLNT